MAVAFLDFEQPIAELEAKIEELKHVTSESEVNIQDEISRLKKTTARENRPLAWGEFEAQFLRPGAAAPPGFEHELAAAAAS